MGIGLTLFPFFFNLLIKEDLYMEIFGLLLQEQYIREFKLRKRLASLLALTGLVVSLYAHYIKNEPYNGIPFISVIFAIVILLPPPKGWKQRVKRNSRKPIFATLKCLAGIALLIWNLCTFNWAPLSCFGLLLVLYACAITPYLGNIKNK